MSEEIISKEKNLSIEDLQDEFHSLRIGEEIPRLQIVRIRKVTNSNKQDNLYGVDYKYLIETKDKKLLRVGSWALWKKIAAALRQAGKIEVDLELKHHAVEDYEVRVI